MTTVDQQLAFAKAFGVMPSRSRPADSTLQQFPQDAAFIDGGRLRARARSTPPGSTRCSSDFDTQLASLARAATPKAILAELQTER